MTERVAIFEPIFVVTMPETIEPGKLYISETYGTAIHLCACGCGNRTVMPFKPFWSSGWDYANDNGLVTFAPSIGNMNFCPNRAHYYIEKNAVRWT